jgi:hypothetical protein
MNVIVSHDIDHITVWEHLFRDTIIPKYMARMHIELLSGKISLREYTLRWSDFFKNKWQNIDELITFNNIHKVPSSFFIAVSKGVGLNYSNEAALIWIEQIKKRNCEIGVHGIAFDSKEKIKEELELFKKLSGQSQVGIRMHYVRNDENTFQTFDETGYAYDSTVNSFENPYKIGNMWEFPFQIMDGWVIEDGKRWQTKNLEQAKENTKHLIDKAFEHKLNYLGIDFHDRYFSHAFKTWVEWYMWVIDYCEAQKMQFVNFEEAIKQLSSIQVIPNSK